jgi:uncharacterized protein
MATSGDRADHFPKIEAKHGQPISFWLGRLAELDSDKYPAQIAYLREEHGFSQAHANAVVMSFRGSPTSRRVDGPEQWFASVGTEHAATARRILGAITARHPELELVTAWNQPMLRNTAGYVMGVSASAKHLTINPWSTDVLESFRPRLAGYKVNKHTFVVPLGWDVDEDLVNGMVEARLAEL